MAITSQAPSVADWLEASGRYQPLSDRTVLELSRRIQRGQAHPSGPAGAPEPVRRSGLRARDQLVRHNLKLIGHTWSRHRSCLPASDESTADAFQEAAINLVRGAEKFDPARGYRFSTYGSFWVRRGFSEHNRKDKRLIRLPYSQAALAHRAHRLSAQHQAKTGHLPSLDWLAQRCGKRGEPVSPEQLGRALEAWRCTDLGRLDRPSSGAAGSGAEDSQSSWLDSIAAPAARPAVDPENAELACGPGWDGQDDPQREALPQLLEALNPQERQLIRHRYLRERPLTRYELQRLMGLNGPEQCALEEQAIAKLRSAAKTLLRNP